MKWLVAVLLLCLVIDESLCQRGGRRGNRPLRKKQRQGRFLAAQNPLGPPPQPAVLLSSAEPIFLSNDEEFAPFQAAPRQGRQQAFREVIPQRGQPFREGRQFDTGTVTGSFPDEEGNYEFQFTDDDGSFRQETGIQGDKDGQISWTSPEGEQINIVYSAGENGYVAESAHIPQNVPLPDGNPDGPGGARNNLKIWESLMQIGK